MEPTPDQDFQRAILRALEDLHNHSLKNQAAIMATGQFISKLDSRLSGVEAAIPVIDENETNVEIDRQIGAQKELISYLFKESHGYVVVVIGVSYAAYFTMLSTISARLSDQNLYISAVLMTVSITIFALWEVFAMSYIGLLSVTNRMGQAKEVPRWYRVAWPIALALSLMTALPAIGLSTWAYISGLRSSLQSPKPSPSAALREVSITPPSWPRPPSPGAAGGP